MNPQCYFMILSQEGVKLPPNFDVSWLVEDNQVDVGTRKGRHRDIPMSESPSSLLQKIDIPICTHTQQTCEKTHIDDLHGRRTTNTHTRDKHQDQQQDTNQGHNCGCSSIIKPHNTFNEHYHDHPQGQHQDTHEGHNHGHGYTRQPCVIF